MNWEDAIEIVKQSEIPYFCFDPEFVNLQIVYAQFMFSAKCTYIAQDQFADDLCGCLDSGLL